MRYRRTLAAVASALALAATAVALRHTDAAAAPAFNYAEALQKSSGSTRPSAPATLPAWNRVGWRGDSGMNDGADVGLDLTGGWYDAGDHVKFGFPMAASATMLAWGAVEYRSAYQPSGQLTPLLEQPALGQRLLHQGAPAPERALRPGGQRRRGPRLVGPGRGDADGPAGVQDRRQLRGSDLAGETAAAMAASSMVFRPTDAAYAEHAASPTPSSSTPSPTPCARQVPDCITDATSYYNSWSGYHDELVWGAIWLYRATNDGAYLAKAESYYDNSATSRRPTPSPTSGRIAWDDKSYGAYVLLAKLTGKQQYIDDAKRWLDYWTVGVNGAAGHATRPGGQACARSAGARCATPPTPRSWRCVYSDWLADADAQGALPRLRGSARSTTSWATTRATPATWSASATTRRATRTTAPRTARGRTASATPAENRHVLYGALVGGPAAPTTSTSTTAATT